MYACQFALCAMCMLICYGRFTNHDKSNQLAIRKLTQHQMGHAAMNMPKIFGLCADKRMNREFLNQLKVVATIPVDRKHELNIFHSPFVFYVIIMCNFNGVARYLYTHSVVGSLPSGKCEKTHSLHHYLCEYCHSICDFFYHTQDGEWKAPTLCVKSKPLSSFSACLWRWLYLSTHPFNQMTMNAIDCLTE